VAISRTGTVFFGDPTAAFAQADPRAAGAVLAAAGFAHVQFEGCESRCGSARKL